MGSCTAKAKSPSHPLHLDLLDLEAKESCPTPATPIEVPSSALPEHTIKGQLSEAQQQPSDDKQVCGREQVGEMVLRVGFACRMGRKAERFNQDDFCLTRKGDLLLLSVFDGHGPDGHRVAAYARDRLPALLLDGYNERLLEFHIKEAFENVHREVLESGYSCELSGTTALVVVVDGNKLISAHVGDSKAVLGKHVNGEYVAEILTKDHKPNYIKERVRIEACGGEIKRLPRDIPDRIFKPGTGLPGLSLSRAIGDQAAHCLGVTHIPEVTSLTLTPSHSFILLCSDGVWEFISPQDAVSLVGQFQPHHAQEAVEKLANLAWQKWEVEEHQRVDDITVVLAYLT